MEINKIYGRYCAIVSRCNLTELTARDSNRSYLGCSLDESFSDFNKFLDWYKLQIGANIPNYQVDKDLLLKGNKIYAAHLCCLLPSEINIALATSKASRGLYPIGVRYLEGRKKPYQAQIGGTKSKLFLGSYATAEEAFNSYKLAKEARIKCLADKYKNDLSQAAYLALKTYQVEITD